MALRDQILARFQRERKELGLSPKELASKYRVSEPYMAAVLHGRADFHGMTIGRLEKMFSDAVLHLGFNTINSISNTGTIAGGITQQISFPDGTAELRSHIIEGLIDLDIPDDARTKILRVVKDA